MLEMKHIFYFNLFNFYNIKKTNNNNKTKLIFSLIKNYYLIIKNHKNLILLSPSDNIKMYYLTLSSVNILLNKKMDKWFIFKLITNNQDDDLF